MPDPAAKLSPAEAVVLLAPNLAKGYAAIKATLLSLLANGVLRIEQTDEIGIFRIKTIVLLRIATSIDFGSFDAGSFDAGMSSFDASSSDASSSDSN